MMDRSEVKSEVLKLSGQPYAPSTKEGWAVLIDSLAAVAESKAHAAEIMDECLRLTDGQGSPRMATVSDIRAIGYATRRTEVRPVRDCQHCYGSGYRVIERRGVSGAARCNCWKRQAVEDQPSYPSPGDTTAPLGIDALAARKVMA